MRRLITITSLALVCVGQSQGVRADEAEALSGKAAVVSSTKQLECPPGTDHLPPVDNGFDQYRHEPDLGAPGSPGSGFRHFPFSMAMFTEWHRPKAATLTAHQRCAPDSFRPRGFGHLFARPCDSFRMDYNPHVLDAPYSKYGPAYIYNQPDQRCQNCDHHR
ncbi:MAG: hypothetical protein R3C59_27840 [Planctomycetaceae bacterium]